MENRKENYIKGVQPIVEEVQKYMSKHNPQFSDITFVNSDNQTLQFVDLVQEGGGTLGIALVGYVYVLEKAGIRFVSMAGTSAGSINTILLASMGKPEEMKSDKVLDVLANKELSDFIDCGIWSFDIEKIALWLFTRKFWGFKRIGEVLTIPIVVIKNLSFGGLCAGRHFEEWLKDILDRNNIYTFGQLKERMNDFPPEIRNRVTADIAIIAADTTTSTKAVFPKMNDLYYDNGNEISPSESVRMSMSIPFIFEPKTIKAPNNWNAKQWKDLTSYIGEPLTPTNDIKFFDGGILSNFPIDIFHENDKIPNRPTFGIRLGRKKNKVTEVPNWVKKIIWVLNKLGTTHSVAGGTFINFSAAFNTARSLRDFEFLQSNREYDMLVGTVDFNEKEFNWMDFFMSEKKKITLFTKGAEAARDFLIKFDWNKYKALRKEMVFENTVKQIVGFSNKNDAISKFGLNKTSLADRFVKIMYPYITRWPINQEYKDMMEKLLKDIKEDISIVEKYVEKSGKAIHILWVDDDADSDIIERSILRLFDIECVVVADTDSATKKLQKENIEDIWLVVSDCYRSNGQTESLRLCRLMAYDESLIQVPVIFHSNSEASDIPESQLQNEIQSFINNNPLAAAFVRKNFSNLQDLIKEILEEISDKIKREGLLK